MGRVTSSLEPTCAGLWSFDFVLQLESLVFLGRAVGEFMCSRVCVCVCAGWMDGWRGGLLEGKETSSEAFAIVQERSEVGLGQWWRY